MITLYNYNHSSAAYRVRICLNLKELDYKMVDINLLEGEEQGNEYLKINPQGLVPALIDDGQKDQVITQSLAIIEYLEETYPRNAVLPINPKERATVRSMTNLIACDIHPLDNTRVLKYLVGNLDVSEDEKMIWYRHWINQGFDALETKLKQSSNGCFCFADSATMADIFLIPQVYNAHRFNIDMSNYPLINSINSHCLNIKAFDAAVPENLN